MRRSLPQALLGLVLANTAGLLLLVVLLQLLAAAGPVAAASGRQGAQDNPLIQIGVVADTGTGQADVAFNGEFITYTVRLTNTSGGILNNVVVRDDVPFEALTNIQCLGAFACTHSVFTETIEEPLGGFLIVTVTTELNWNVPSLGTGGTAALIFRGRIAGQSDGTLVHNDASVTTVNGSAIFGADTAVDTTVRVPIADVGYAQVSNAATWFSSDLGGTLSQDWGDINRDGYMDLVLGSSVGTSVFINEGGRLKQLNWPNSERTYGVRWADFNGDGRLDIVAVGQSAGGQANQPGSNYVYGQFTDPVTLSPTFSLSATFASDFQLVRVGVGDFDADQDVDIVASTNSINAPCPVLLYRNNGVGQFNTAPQCISTTATAAIGPGDYDNDGDLDLALGLFPDTIAIFVNNNGAFNQTAIVNDALSFLPYDFAWGDYNLDGKLDLAAAFPLQKEARVFRNIKGQTFDPEPFDTANHLVFRTASFLTPLAVDWGDFNGDGLLDLLVADEAPKVYLNQPTGDAFRSNAVLASNTLLGQKWGIRGVALDLSGELSLAITNRDRPTQLLEGFASHLASNVTPLNQQVASSLAWGDADNDSDLDLLLGTGPQVLGTALYYNSGGTISSTAVLNLFRTGSGPHQVAFGDVNGDRRLEIVVATPGGVQLYEPAATQPSWSAAAASQVAFTDANSDGRLDLLAATAGGGISLYLNLGTSLDTAPVFTTQITGDVRSLSVADYNRDFYPDFAAAFVNAPARVFLNNKNNTFTPIWSSGTALDTRSVAWGDFNSDGYPDLAVAHYQQGTQIYRNLTGTLGSTAIWSSPTLSKTTAVAWGDWDNDGFPELAIGNSGEPNQVFANLESEPNRPRLYWLWTSADSDNTTGVAWGDVDGDGDLDLGVSKAGGSGHNGYYKNGSLTPSHHLNSAEDYLRTMPLSNNPPYVGVPRPGETSDAYLWSSSEVLGLGSTGNVTIFYEQYDPDGARRTPETGGDPLARTFFEFSLDGGATWKRASSVSGSPAAVTSTNRQGVLGSFQWDARRDQAISDDARFRIRVVPQLAYGPTQRASTIGVSPPFRIRALSLCRPTDGAPPVWPNGANIALSAEPPVPGATMYLTGSVLAGTGPLTYTWQFSDRITPTLGQITNHQWLSATTYAVTLTVTGPACPVTRPVVVTRQWGVPATPLEPRAFLPFVGFNAANAAISAADPAATPATATAEVKPSETATATVEATATITATETVTATATETMTATATSQATAESTATANATSTETATAGPTDTPTPEASPTLPPPDPAATGTPTQTTGAGPSAWRLPQVGVGVHLSHGQPTVRTVGFEQTAAAGPADSLIFVTTPGSVGISNEPTISSDGKYMAFWSTANLQPAVGNSDGNIELFLAEKASPVRYTQVTNSTGSILGGFNLSPSMNDSGTRVAFFSDRDLIGQNPESSFQIYLYDTTSLALSQVTTRTRGFNILPSLSGDGQAIAFVSDRNYGASSDGTTEAEGNSEIAVARLTGGTIRITPVTTTTNQSNDEPQIDFDGNRIVFISTANLVGQNGDNSREVFVASIQPDGSVQYTQITDTDSLANTGQASISADGNYVAFVSDRDPNPAFPASPPCACRIVYRATLNSTGQLTGITLASNNTSEVGLAQPSISADGTRIAFISAGSTTRVVLHDVLSDAETAIDVADNTLNPALSAGGTAVAFASEKQIMWAEFPLAELSISKSVAPLVAFPGDVLRYTVVVTNAGPSVATGVVVTDVLPNTGFNFTTSPDQIDDDNDTRGFGASGSVFSNTTWSSALNPDALTLQDGFSGTYTARVMDAGADATWTQLTWRPERPYGKPLPDNGASETAYTAGNANMSGVGVLLHFDDTASTEAYANSASSVAPPATCSLSAGTCPQAGASGRLGASALFFGNPQHLDVNVLPDEPAYTVAFWFKTLCADCGLLQVGRGQLGNAGRDRQLLLNGGNVCSILSNEVACAVGAFADDQWHHVAYIYGNPTQAGGAQRLYIDGELRTTGVISTSLIVDDAVINIGYAFNALSPFYSGSLDELAVFGRSLSSAEILSLYQRGALQLAFQVRTCTLANCADGGAFVGPGGLPSTYYSEADNFTANLPAVTLDSLPVRRFFQYEASLTTTNDSYSPHLQRVEVGPSHGAVETHQGFCQPPVRGQTIRCDLTDLAAGEVATVTISVTPTTYGALVNTAWVTSDIEEHDPVNVASASPNVLPLPIEVFTLNLAGVPGLAGNGHTFTATVGPVTASTPVTYLWQATNQVSFTVSGGLSNTAVLTWFTGGPQVVTVTAINAANVLSNTPGLTATLSLVVSNPVPQLTDLNPRSATIDTGPVTVVITGSQFVGTSQVRWAGNQALSRTVASSTRILATVPLTLLQTAGGFPITVFNPTPGGGTSPQTITFTVNHPPPSGLVLSPTTAVAGGRAFSLTVTGSNFYPGAQISWNGSPRTTDVNIATQTLTATITAADINAVGTRTITVTNPLPNSGPSAGVSFDVTALGLTLEPPTLSMGVNQSVVLTATISAVQAANRVIALTSSNPVILSVPATINVPANATQVTFTANSGSLGGQVIVTGTLPAAQGGGQGQVQVTVLNPAPTITGTNPISASAGGITLTPLQVFGTNFLPGVRVFWNGTALPSTLVGGVIEVDVSASLIALTNTASLTAVNALPNTGASAPFPFTTGLPTLTLSPASVTTGISSAVVMTASTNTPRAAATVITVTSSNIGVASVPGTVTIPAGSASVAFTMQAGAIGGSASLTATLPAAYGLISDTASVVVNNSAPIITSLWPSSVTAGSGSFVLTVNGSGFVGNSDVRHGTVTFPNNATDFIDSGTLSVTVNSSLITNAGFITITVFNSPPPSGGLTSNVMTLTVNNPAPVIQTVSPATATVGGPAFTLNLTGTSFVNNALLYFGGQSHPTNVFASGTRLTATIAANEIDTIGTVPITITNPLPTNASPSSVPFTITQLGLTLAPAGTFTVTGGSTSPLTVTLSAPQAAPTVISMTASPAGNVVVPVTVTVPAGALTHSFPITATDAATVTLTADLAAANLGPATSSITLVIQNAPVAGLAAGNDGPKDIIWPGLPTVSVNFTSSVTGGTNVVYTWAFGDGTFDTSNQANLSHSYQPIIGQVYTAVVTATNSINTVTATTQVVFNNRTPTLTAISPTTFTQGSGAQNLVLTGTQFVTGTTVYLRGVGHTPTFIASTRTTMTVSLTPADLGISGTYTISVIAPAPPTPNRQAINTPSIRIMTPVSGLAASNSGPVDVGTAVTLTATAQGEDVVYQWLPGDGTGPFAGSVLAHAYPSAIGGVYTAVVTATNAVSGPFTATTIVTLNNLTPTISAIAPVSQTGNSDFVITISGTNFVPGSQIEWNNSASLITPVSINGAGTLMTANIAGTRIPNPNTNYPVRVVAPAPPTPRRESAAAIFRRE